MFDRPGKVCSSVDFHAKALNDLLAEQTQNVVVDNTYPTVASRKLAVDLAKKYGYEIECWMMGTSIEQTEYNVATRMVKRYGKLVSKNETEKTKNDSNIFPASVLFDYKKKLEEPSTEEGFNKVEKLAFKRIYDISFTNKAIILDYDGTLRTTISGTVSPNDPADIQLLPDRIGVLKKYKDMGYLILGVSNQAGIARGYVTEDQAIACFKKTNELLGMNIDYLYCPHNIPINCYCRKPMPGNGVVFIERYKLDPSLCIMVGDMTSDKTFAKRCGFQYVDQAEFFK